MCVCMNITTGSHVLTQISARARLLILQDGLSSSLPHSAPVNTKLTRSVRADVHGARCLCEEEEKERRGPWDRTAFIRCQDTLPNTKVTTVTVNMQHAFKILG